MKSKIKKILLFLSLLIVGGSIISLSIVLVNLLKNDDKTLYVSQSINNGKSKYLSLLDSKAKNILDNSTYSVSFKFAKENTLKISYGTAWSLGVVNDSWLLMTNLHVVKNYLEYKNSYGNIVTNVSHKDFGLMYQNFNESYSNYMQNFLPTINCNITSKTNINIISDPNLNDDVHLFADETHNETQWNKYELDMALIQISDSEIANSIRNNNSINKPLNIYERGTKPLTKINELSDLIVGGYPIKEEYHLYDKYYLEVINKDRFWFDRLSDWNKYIYNGLKPNDRNFKQYASMLISNAYILESNSDDYGWSLSGGASGSPLYDSISYENSEPLWIPVAIYWGGLTNNNENKQSYIRPCFTMLISSLQGCQYNIFDNVINFFNKI